MPLTKVCSACVSITSLIPATGIWFLPGCCWNVSWHSQSCVVRSHMCLLQCPEPEQRSCSRNSPSSAQALHHLPLPSSSITGYFDLWLRAALENRGSSPPALPAAGSSKRWAAVHRAGSSPGALHTLMGTCSSSLRDTTASAGENWDQALAYHKISLLWGEGFHPTVYYKTQIMYFIIYKEGTELKGTVKTQSSSPLPVLKMQHFRAFLWSKLPFLCQHGQSSLRIAMITDLYKLYTLASACH